MTDKELKNCLLSIVLFLGGTHQAYAFPHAESDNNKVTRQNQDEWDNSRSLRNKINIHIEKEYDKLYNLREQEEACNKSLNASAYWEPNTLRCLDRNTGHPLTP